TRAAKGATSTIPIVMTNDSDPVATGFVASLARPGGNITGLATLRSELSGKQLELLKETIPKLSRVAFFGTSTDPANTESLRETELAQHSVLIFALCAMLLTLCSPARAQQPTKVHRIGFLGSDSISSA